MAVIFTPYFCNDKEKRYNDKEENMGPDTPPVANHCLIINRIIYTLKKQLPVSEAQGLFGERNLIMVPVVAKDKKIKNKKADALCQCVTWPSSGGDTFVGQRHTERENGGGERLRLLTFVERQRVRND